MTKTVQAWSSFDKDFDVPSIRQKTYSDMEDKLHPYPNGPSSLVEETDKRNKGLEGTGKDAQFVKWHELVGPATKPEKEGALTKGFSSVIGFFFSKSKPKKSTWAIKCMQVYQAYRASETLNEYLHK